MPRVSDDGAVGFGLRCEGLYRHVVARRCWVDACVGGADPRTALSAATADDLAASVLRAELGADDLLQARLGAGEPVSAAFWEVVGGGYGLPREDVPDDWQVGQEFTVHCDDTVVCGVPAS